MSDQDAPFLKGDWVTNTPKSIKGFWPRRKGVKYVEGPPKATEVYSAITLQKQGLVGIYLDEDCPDYWDREQVWKHE